MTESVKDPNALTVTALPQMLEKLQLSEVRAISSNLKCIENNKLFLKNKY